MRKQFTSLLVCLFFKLLIFLTYLESSDTDRARSGENREEQKRRPEEKNSRLTVDDALTILDNARFGV